MIKWYKFGRIVHTQGDVAAVNIYAADDCDYTIESRRMRIPHARGGTYWEKTFYYVLKDGEEIKMLYSLTDAKEYVEKLEGGTK